MLVFGFLFATYKEHSVIDNKRGMKRSEATTNFIFDYFREMMHWKRFHTPGQSLTKEILSRQYYDSELILLKHAFTFVFY